jgi:ABC-type Fe3+-hydroxamate transport system substrate-binding protein
LELFYFKILSGICLEAPYELEGIMVEMEVDWLGFLDQFHDPPSRVVSLVPSVTESLFELNFGENVVGVTDFCVHPGEKVAPLPKVGGTKNPHPDQILALNPDLVIANREENTRSVVETLVAAGVPVWVTYPKTVDESIALLRGLARLFQRQLALQQVEMLEVALEWAEAAASDHDPVSYFCPIWQESGEGDQPMWLTFNQDTYCHDLLARLGGYNIFSHHGHQPPGDPDPPDEQLDEEAIRDTRYPRILPAQVVEGQPELILLPDEPFPFSLEHLPAINQVLKETPAVAHQQVRLFEGSLLTWHGTRLALALQSIPLLFDK